MHSVRFFFHRVRGLHVRPRVSPLPSSHLWTVRYEVTHGIRYLSFATPKAARSYVRGLPLGARFVLITPTGARYPGVRK